MSNEVCGCDLFIPHKWKKNVCRNCFLPVGDHTQVSVETGQKKFVAITGQTDSSSSNHIASASSFSSNGSALTSKLASHGDPFSSSPNVLVAPIHMPPPSSGHTSRRQSLDLQHHHYTPVLKPSFIPQVECAHFVPAVAFMLENPDKCRGQEPPRRASMPFTIGSNASTTTSTVSRNGSGVGDAAGGRGGRSNSNASGNGSGVSGGPQNHGRQCLSTFSSAPAVASAAEGANRQLDAVLLASPLTRAPSPPNQNTNSNVTADVVHALPAASATGTAQQATTRRSSAASTPGLSPCPSGSPACTLLATPTPSPLTSALALASPAKPAPTAPTTTSTTAAGGAGGAGAGLAPAPARSLGPAADAPALSPAPRTPPLSSSLPPLSSSAPPRLSIPRPPSAPLRAAPLLASLDAVLDLQRRTSLSLATAADTDEAAESPLQQLLEALEEAGYNYLPPLPHPTADADADTDDGADTGTGAGAGAGGKPLSPLLSQAHPALPSPHSTTSSSRLRAQSLATPPQAPPAWRPSLQPPVARASISISRSGFGSHAEYSRTHDLSLDSDTEDWPSSPSFSAMSHGTNLTGNTIAAATVGSSRGDRHACVTADSERGRGPEDEDDLDTYVCEADPPYNNDAALAAALSLGMGIDGGVCGNADNVEPGTPQVEVGDVRLPCYGARPSFSVQWSQAQVQAQRHSKAASGRHRSSVDARSQYGTLRGSMGSPSSPEKEEEKKVWVGGVEVVVPPRPRLSMHVWNSKGELGEVQTDLTLDDLK